MVYDLIKYLREANGAAQDPEVGEFLRGETPHYCLTVWCKTARTSREWGEMRLLTLQRRWPRATLELPCG